MGVACTYGDEGDVKAKIVWWADEVCHKLGINWNWLCDLNDRLITGDE